MPKLLRNLVVDEVSSVNRGAADGARVMLWKRAAGNPPAGIMGAIRKRLGEYREKVLSLIVAGGARTAIVDKLHDATDAVEAALAADISVAARGIMEKVTEMDTGQGITTDDRGLARGTGVDAMYALFAEMQSIAGERMSVDDRDRLLRAAFDRYEGAQNRSVDDAIGISGGPAHARRMVTARPTNSRPFDASQWAYDQIAAKGAGLRTLDAKLSEAQAFEKVYRDPANSELVSLYKSGRRGGGDAEAVSKRVDNIAGAALDRLNEMAAEHRRGHPGMSEAAAFTHVATKTHDGQSLMRLHQETFRQGAEARMQKMMAG